MASVSSLIASYTEAQQQAAAANRARQTQIEELLNKAITRYSPGGGFGAGYETQLATQKVRDVGTASQSLISSGLYGTEVGANIGTSWEAAVGAPARLSLEDLRGERLTSAESAKAGFLGGIADEYPDYGSLMQAISSMASIPSMPQNPYMQDLGSSGGYSGGYSGGFQPTTSYSQPSTSYIAPNITMGTPYGPKFQTQAEMATATKKITTPTVSEQKQITSNLQRMYPQMYNPDGTLKALYR